MALSLRGVTVSGKPEQLVELLGRGEVWVVWGPREGPGAGSGPGAGNLIAEAQGHSCPVAGWERAAGHGEVWAEGRALQSRPWLEGSLFASVSLGVLRRNWDQEGDRERLRGTETKRDRDMEREREGDGGRDRKRQW